MVEQSGQWLRVMKAADAAAGSEALDLLAGAEGFGIAVSTATDVAKGAVSVVVTESGLTNIVALVEQGRTIYQRILTWVVNKISRAILKAAFVSIAFVVTGKFVVSAFAMLLLTFMTAPASTRLATHCEFARGSSRRGSRPCPYDAQAIHLGRCPTRPVLPRFRAPRVGTNSA